jgi:hypothetical protein
MRIERTFLFKQPPLPFATHTRNLRAKKRLHDDAGAGMYSVNWVLFVCSCPRLQEPEALSPDTSSESDEKLDGNGCLKVKRHDFQLVIPESDPPSFVCPNCDNLRPRRLLAAAAYSNGEQHFDISCHKLAEVVAIGGAATDTSNLHSFHPHTTISTFCFSSLHIPHT